MSLGGEFKIIKVFRMKNVLLINFLKLFNKLQQDLMTFVGELEIDIIVVFLNTFTFNSR
jgi:hypothetical protein